MIDRVLIEREEKEVKKKEVHRTQAHLTDEDESLSSSSAACLVHLYLYPLIYLLAG